MSRTSQLLASPRCCVTSHENDVPHAAFEQAINWHAAALALDVRQGTVVIPQRLFVMRHEAALTRSDVEEHEEPEPHFDAVHDLSADASSDVAASISLDLNSALETPINFGPNNALLGILCEPRHQRHNAPAVLLANTGANPRYGNARVAVTIARWLAAQGIVSLRMDGVGIGDAAPETGERGMPYSAAGDRDISAGVDALMARCNTPVVVLGMCSGAYHALQAAFQDPRIKGLVLINLQKFFWHGNESLSVVQRTTFRTTRFYMRNAVSATIWQRILRGDINVVGITRALAGRAMRRVSATCDPAIRLLRGTETPVGRVRRQVRGLAVRSVPILFGTQWQ